MRLVIQRVSSASVAVEGETVGRIGRGLLVLFGAGHGDTQEQASRYARKLSTLRIFADEQGKTNLSSKDVGGGILVVSQFTLYADCRNGNRPGFTGAAAPEEAERLYEFFLSECRRYFGSVEKGIFGAEMAVSLVNDGPFTLVWDSRDW